MKNRNLSPIVIAHRGASSYRPEHTLAAYAAAVEQGADFIEPDLVITKDGHLVARHENEISTTTDVGRRREFADRKRVKSVDGIEREGWFSEDFTLAEMKSLRARERLPHLRPASARFDGHFEVPTLEEIIAFLHAANRRLLGPDSPAPQRRHKIGLYPELKHPSHFKSLGYDVEKRLLDALHCGEEMPFPIFIQCFEVATLKRLKFLSDFPLVQLLDAGGKPHDFVLAGDARSFADLATEEGLAGIAAYADAIGPAKALVFPDRRGCPFPARSRLIEAAHKLGLQVHPWAFRAENAFLPPECRSSPHPEDAGSFGEMAEELGPFLIAGIDGFFTDHPDIGRRIRDSLATNPRHPGGHGSR